MEERGGRYGGFPSGAGEEEEEEEEEEIERRSKKKVRGGGEVWVLIAGVANTCGYPRWATDVRNTKERKGFQAGWG